nr:MAG TPA: hypothetical protein [Caudoviricetes sp.]
MNPSSFRGCAFGFREPVLVISFEFWLKQRSSIGTNQLDKDLKSLIFTQFHTHLRGLVEKVGLCTPDPLIIPRSPGQERHRCE